MRVLIAAVCVGTAVALAVPPAHGFSISAKAAAKKIQADLVPAYSPVDTGAVDGDGNPTTGSGHGDDEGDNPSILATPFLRSSKCTFETGKVTYQVGKDAQVQLKNVKCDGTPYDGSLCAHTKVLNTIMDEDVDKNGVVTPKVCLSPAGTSTEATLQWVTGNVGRVACSKGQCKGTIPPVLADPCPDVDKVSELRRFEVFDGPDEGSTTILGATLASCCGPGQVVAGPIPVSTLQPCDTSTQDVMAGMGYINQGVQPK
jgi:hypothetical protein